MYLRDKRLNGCLRYAQTVALESDPPTRPRHRQMPHAIVFYNDCFNVNFQIFDSQYLPEVHININGSMTMLLGKPFADILHVGRQTVFNGRHQFVRHLLVVRNRDAAAADRVQGRPSLDK